VHFFCEKCHKTFCLHGTPLPAVNIPEGFQVNSANYMLIGVCEKCK
jgi:Fur family ferric uptake transcriptional regulator